jgi:Pectinesterase/Bacterial Ig-like domain
MTGGSSSTTGGAGETTTNSGRGGVGGSAPSAGATASGGTRAQGGFGQSGGGAGGAPLGGAGNTLGAGAGGSATSGGMTNGGGGIAGAVAAGGSAGRMTGLPAGVSALFPGPGAANVCNDPQLRITFDAPPTLGNSGTIQVLTSSGSVAASVNMATATVSDTIGGQTFTLERRVYVDGNTAIVYLPSKGLAYGQTYSVNIPAGAIVPSGGGSFSVTGTAAWSFSTALAAPSSLANIAVALDGTGAFCSLQGALDAVPSNGSVATTISLKDGNYHEVVYFKNKNNLTVEGESRSGTVILGTNNNNMNPSTKTRALVGGDNNQELTFANLTIQNLTPQGGSQAEALRLEGCTHCTIHDADIESLQDTLLWSGTLYAKNCFIAGNVDFVWGTGAAYFDACEIKTVGTKGYVVQARNPTSGYGYVFVDSKITADEGITGSVLARIDVSAYPGSHVAYVNCAIGSHISRAGWLVTGGSPPSSLRFWEYQSTDLDGDPLDVSGRLAGSTQISAADAATMRDPSAVLGGWQPN